MVEQIKSSEIKIFIEKNPRTVLLDVRTQDEWNNVGKPVTGSLGIKTFFITINEDPIFVQSIKKEISKDYKILVMCAAGGRSALAANILQDEGYNAYNVLDGFSGNEQDIGWKKSGLPTD